jgi:hypothetical protein
MMTSQTMLAIIISNNDNDPMPSPLRRSGMPGLIFKSWGVANIFSSGLPLEGSIGGVTSGIDCAEAAGRLNGSTASGCSSQLVF